MLLRLAVLAAVVCTLAAHTAHHANDESKPDCLKAGDGYYVAGCSAKFWRCVNDRLYQYDCPKGLYFNPLKRKCEYKADVPICTQGVKMDTRNVIKASAEFNCTGLEDGQYKPQDIACSNTFITCFTGMAVEQACPFGQFFHEKNKACDYKENVPGCLASGGSKIGGTIGTSCTPLRTGHVDMPCDADEICQAIDAPRDGRYLCSTPFSVWYGPLGRDSSDQWTIAPNGLRCGEDGRWYNGNIVVETPAVDCTAKRTALAGEDRSYGAEAPAPPQRSPVSVNAKAATLNACPGLKTGKDGIPCASDEICQEIKRPKNGRYSCEAPFAVWYGPINGGDAQWKQAKEALVCGTDGFWYDSGVMVNANGIDCSAKKSAFKKKEDETLGCPSLSTNEKDIPCKKDEEFCKPIQRAVAGKYACPTPYRVWYVEARGGPEAWKQAKDSLICKSGSWFDGDVKTDATAVDCTVSKIDCSKLADGNYNGEPGKCSNHFWQCSNEQAYLYPCAPGLFFDDFSKNCDYKEVIESCGGTRREPSAATTTTTAATPALAADASKKTDCPAVFTDSSLPCRSGEACVAPADPVNQKYLCETPYSLWFGPKSNADQWRQAPNGIQCKNGQWFNGEEQITPEAVHCTTPKFACAGKKDGSYSAHPEKCTAYFWNCAHDDSFLYTCPAGLFFDIDTLSCDYKEVIVACGGRKKDTKEEELVPASDAVVLSFNCAGKENGYHEDGKCQKKFWNCADGKTFQIDCPEGLVYDGRVQLCQYPAACEAELPVTTTTPAAPARDQGEKKPAQPTTSFDCSTKADGIYAEKKCHKQFIQCTNGRTFAKECPAGLVYTPFKDGCDYKQVCMNPPSPTTTTTTVAPAADEPAEYQTYERTPVTTTTTQAPVAPASFDSPNCANLEDGAHAMARCGQEFFLCWQGKAEFSKCTDDLIFNPHNAQCDYRSSVIECGAAADATTTAAPGMIVPITPSTTTTAAPDLFCEGREDGHFGSGCQTFFYSCQTGATHKMFCPTGLHYDADSKTCDVKELIVACGGKKPTTPAAAPAVPAVPSAYTYTAFRPTPAPQDQPMPPVDRFCAGKKDGFYALDCQHFFYSCQDGMTYKMTCPTDLYYDFAKKTCNRREENASCGAPTTTQAPTTPAAAPTSSYLPMNVNPIPAKDLPVVLVDRFCDGKEDGFYPVGCSAFFYSCHNGITHKMDCSSGLFYDAGQKRCDRRETIVACGAAPSTTQTPTTPAAAPASSAYARPAAPVKDIPVVSDRFCIGKEDAFYGSGCQQFFYSCQAGITYKMDCPSGLFYDADQKKCDRREDIVACGAAPSTTQAPVTKAADVPAVVVENFCSGKTDGFYTLGCSSFFYSCQSGTTYKLICPSGLYYDIEKKQCLNKEEIAACGAPAPTTPASAPTAAPTPYAAKAADTPVAPVTENFCAGKNDVMVGSGCQNVFYNCHDGVAYKTTCSEGLFFDAEVKMCNYRELIVACGGKKPEPTIAPAVPALDRPAVTVEMFCLAKEDGFYGVDCSTFFYSCTNSASYKMNCPSGLFYDAINKHCDRRDEIAACGATSTPSIVLAPAAPAYSTSPIPSRDQSPIPLITPENFCAGKVDGFYGGNGCVDHFFSCSNGFTSKMMCPSGLFYDVAGKKCDNREDIVACGATARPVTPVVPAAAPSQSAAPSPYAKPVLPVQPRTTAAPVRDVTPVASTEKFCVGKADGTYSVGCDSYYYSCLYGATYKMACPSGLFYDNSRTLCDTRENIEACGGKPAVVNPVAPIVRDQQPVPIVDKFCFGKADGFYGLNCEAHFYSCNNGYTYKMLCPSGLFYDVTIKACNNKEKVVSCGGVAAAPALPVMPVQPATAAPLYSAPAAPQVIPAAAPAAPTVFDPKFCVGKSNGLYTMGCADFYYDCQNGYTHKMICSPGLFYDAAAERCDYRENIAVCGGQQPLPQILPAPTTAAPMRDVVAPVDNFCSGKPNGAHTLGCETFYYDCQNGYTHKMACPAGLFYDHPSKRCDIKENVAACGAQPQPQPQQAQPLPQSQYQPAPAATLAPVRDVVAPIVLVENFCTGKPDGVHAQGCAGFYYNCQNGYTYKMACPSGLIFDVTSKRCEQKETVVACGGQPQLAQPQPQPKSGYQTVPAATVAPVRDTPVAPVVLVDNFCAGKADGVYSQGCAGFYYHCQNAYTYKMACPAALIFDITTKRCEQKESVVACGGQPQLAQPQPQPQSQYQPAPLATVAPVRDVVVPADNFCSGKIDGDHAQGCAGFYFNCQNGYTTKMACPSGLIFDVASKRCERKETVAACGGQPQLAQPQPQPQSQYQPAATSAPARDVVENFCSGKANGDFAQGCAGFYYSCQNGYTTKMACPSGLFFDITTKRCEQKETVAACGGQPQLAQPQPRPQSQYQPAPLATAAPVRDVVAVDNFCSGKADGIYAQGCVGFYYDCQNGYTHKMACPSGLFYEVSSKRCEAKENVKACGVQQPQLAQPQTQYQPAPTAPVAPVRDPVALPAVDRFCAGMADGQYGDGCKNFFYYCTNGATYRMECGINTYYDVSTKQCEFIEKVVACGGKPQLAQPQPQTQYQQAPAATAAPSPPGYAAPTTTAAPAAASYARPSLAKDTQKPITDKSCVGKENSIFGEGCNPFFFSCINGAVYKMSCPAGLFYDLDLQSCQYKDHVPNCGGRRVEVPATPAPALDVLPPAPVNDEQCNGKKDGFYAAADCSPEYYSCQYGRVRKEACKTGLFFNEANNMCDWRDNLPKCTARDTLPTRAPATDEYARSPSRPITRPSAPKYDSHKEEYQKTKKPALAPSGSTCNGQADGYYANGCSTEYTACANGHSIAMHCPSDLKYSVSSQMCDYADNVPECGGSVPVVGRDEPLAPRPTTPPVVPLPSKTYTPTQAPAKEVHPRCAGRSDGIYALAPCSQNYLACVDEKATIGLCRDDLFYSTVSGLCDWKEKIPSCTMLVRPTPLTTRSIPTTTTPLPIAPVADVVVRPSGDRLMRPTAPLGVKPDCTQIADGVYAVNACSPFYSRCTEGRHVAHGTCPIGTVFSPMGRSCVEKSAVAACAAPVPPPMATPPPTQAPFLAPPAVSQTNYGVQPAQQQPVYQQQQQYQQPMTYQQPQQTYTQQYAPSYSATYASNIYADPSQFCYSRPNGIYGNTCQKSYVICNGGATVGYQCPNDFVFNRERAVCDHPSRMPQCGGATAYGYTAPSYGQQQTAYSAPAYQQQSYSNY